MLVGFDKWWQEEGKMIDPDTEDVPWFDKRQALADLAFEAGTQCGMARAANYTADDAVGPGHESSFHRELKHSKSALDSRSIGGD